MTHRLKECHLSTDIDECASRTHDCSPDAECENINGSYKCSCKLGYSGDGQNCQGKLRLIGYKDDRKKIMLSSLCDRSFILQARFPFKI